MSKSTEQCIKIYVRNIIFSNPGNVSLPYHEVVSDVVSDSPNNKSHSLTSLIINSSDIAKLAAKLTITQEEVSIAYSTTHI